MKKMFCILLAALLLLSGCQTSVQETTAPQTSEEATLPLASLPPEADPEVAVTLPKTDGLTFANPGKARITYTGNRSYVKYVTSVEDLPQEEALAAFDEAFFEEKALLIVVETANSGSVHMELESILVFEGTATVSLKRSMTSDFGTADMATWLLWVELEQGLDYTWVLENASQLPQGEKY